MLAASVSGAALNPDDSIVTICRQVLQLSPEKAKPTLERAYARLGPGPAEQVIFSGL